MKFPVLPPGGGGGAALAPVMFMMSRSPQGHVATRPQRIPPVNVYCYKVSINCHDCHVTVKWHGMMKTDYGINPTHRLVSTREHVIITNNYILNSSTWLVVMVRVR